MTLNQVTGEQLDTGETNIMSNSMMKIRQQEEKSLAFDTAIVGSAPMKFGFANQCPNFCATWHDDLVTQRNRTFVLPSTPVHISCYLFSTLPAPFAYYLYLPNENYACILEGMEIKDVCLAVQLKII